MDITCVIAIQTSIQKKYFFQWGDTLVMDWTHGTNNMGYHLGSLVVTTATGIGIPLSGRVLETIQTIVIDKDFVEWRVLDKAFPDAKVLLCQFHALTYWHKVCKCDKFKMKVTERDTMESAFAKLIYCKTQSTFDAKIETFKQTCKAACP
ncbi:hypothetical protein PC123_g26124 [Phytophthora cactorum]|nr:hypothetical protein PC123_g26124 [Phytophthora cactorum]